MKKKRFILFLIRVLEFDWKSRLVYWLYSQLESDGDEQQSRYYRPGGRYDRNPRK